MGYGFFSGRYNGSRLTYGEAVDYLSKARNKWDRPLHGRASTRIMWLGTGTPGTDSIALRLYNTICVVIHPDDTYTINTGGYHTRQTVSFINNYSTATTVVERERHKSYGYTHPVVRISDRNNTTSPPRVWKCRTCSGTGTSDYMASGSWDTGAYVLFEDGPRLASCYRCKGTGRVDYGSKTIYTVWDGTWLRVDGDGNAVDYEPESAAYKFYGHTKSQPIKKKYEPVHADVFGPFWEDSSAPSHDATAPSHDVSGTLYALLPGLRTRVYCPANGNVDCESLQVSDQVIHLNDTHRWTREQIADWLDTLDVDLRFNAAA